jgi:hypothetical protein
MKNLFFSLAFMLIGVVGFANTSLPVLKCQNNSTELGYGITETTITTFSEKESYDCKWKFMIHTHVYTFLGFVVATDTEILWECV